MFFCATTSPTLWNQPLNCWYWQCFIYCPYMPDPHTNYKHPIRLSVTELWLAEFDHSFVSSNSNCACAVSRDPSSGGGSKFVQFKKNPLPQFAYSLRRTLTHVISENSIKPIIKAIKLTVHAQYHMTCAYEVLKITRNNFWPRIVYSLYNLHVATTKFRGSLYVSVFTLKWFLAVKNCAIKVSLQNGGNLRV